MSGLDLGWRDDAGRDSDPGRRGRERRAPLIVVAVVVVVLAIAVVVAVTAGVHFLTGGPADYHGQGFGSVVVEVDQGDSATAIGQRLHDASVVKSVGAFTDAADADSRSRTIAPGYYRLHHHMSGAAALALLLDPASLVKSRVTIPEGFTVEQTVARIAQDTTVKMSSLTAALQQPAALRLPSYANGHVEGFLFPATYVFAPHTTGVAALREMVGTWYQRADDVNLAAGARALGYSPYDVLIVASLLEREAKFAPDYGKTARVIYNRLHLGMPLQLDSTVNYALHANKTYVTNADTRTPSLYNTYLHTGLPPTPIDSPGELALNAALHPPAGTWLYFVTIDRAGHNAYTSNYQQFLQLKAQAERNTGP